MIQPRITIITPCRNQDRYIEQALCSVLDQGYGNLEYIVIDAMSDDRSAQVIELYRHRIKHFIRQSDNGPAEALNQALSRATGDIIGILYADDLYLPGPWTSSAGRWPPRNPHGWWGDVCASVTMIRCSACSNPNSTWTSPPI
ncbi:MAG: glycosyltransferase [Phycisphaerales bacterium]|nr:glycosyltransferase [Phycisphaerales bacterium]